jgi:hypothetical protein
MVAYTVSLPDGRRERCTVNPPSNCRKHGKLYRSKPQAFEPVVEPDLSGKQGVESKISFKLRKHLVQAGISDRIRLYDRAEFKEGYWPRGTRKTAMSFDMLAAFQVGEAHVPVYIEYDGGFFHNGGKLADDALKSNTLLESNPDVWLVRIRESPAPSLTEEVPSGRYIEVPWVCDYSSQDKPGFFDQLSGMIASRLQPHEDDMLEAAHRIQRANDRLELERLDSSDFSEEEHMNQQFAYWAKMHPEQFSNTKRAQQERARVDKLSAKLLGDSQLLTDSGLGHLQGAERAEALRILNQPVDESRVLFPAED